MQYAAIEKRRKKWQDGKIPARNKDRAPGKIELTVHEIAAAPTQLYISNPHRNNDKERERERERERELTCY